MKKRLLFPLSVILGTVFILQDCISPNSGGTETGDARITGMLYNSNGARAAHAKVSVTRWSSSPRENDVIEAMTVTDNNGTYKIDSLPSGTYNIFGSGDSGLSYLDSIIMDANDDHTRLPPDTLRPAGSIRGRIQLQQGDDPRTVLILFMGTNIWSSPKDSSGNFIVPKLAEGAYRVRFLPTLDNYLPKDTTLSVTAGAENLLPYSIILKYTGLPVPSGLSASYDTLHGCSVLKWNPVAFTDLAGYVIYRNDTASTTPVRLNDKLVTDTGYIDTIFADLMDTANYTFTYRIKAQDNNANLSTVFSNAFTVDAPSPTRVRTFITWKFLNTIGDSASINDTVSVIASYKNSTRKNVRLQWFADRNDSLVRTVNDTSFFGSDTMRFWWRDASAKKIFVAMTDQSSTTWWDSATVKIVQDVPVVDAGNDTIVVINDTAHLHGAATQRFGTIVKWEWKIDSGSWNPISGPDTFFIVPLTEQTVMCSLAVTDDDGNRAVDEIKIIVFITVKNVAAGVNHSMILKTDGTAWACGSNYNGQLGDGSGTNQPTPVQVMSDVKSLAAGSSFSLFLKTDATLWACGHNALGQLGDGTTTNQPTPVQVMGDVKSMAGGGTYSLFLKTDGTLWTCGHNDFGQLGDSTTTNRVPPMQVMNDVQSIAAGECHTLILKTDATLWVCGFNMYGQLGDGTTTNRAIPVQIMSDVKSMAAGRYHSLILKTDGTLWACGDNRDGQLGDGSMTSQNTPVQVMNDVQDIAAGKSNSMIFKTDGTLWFCGDNGYGQSGNGEGGKIPRPVQVMSGVKNMASGWEHSLILKTDGTLWACGYNADGELGDGTVTGKSTPVRIVPLQR